MADKLTRFFLANRSGVTASGIERSVNSVGAGSAAAGNSLVDKIPIAAKHDMHHFLEINILVFLSPAQPESWPRQLVFIRIVDFRIL
ncbi:hypothetical protein AY633_08525 [Planococcus maritimus]|nr:hypothetical protein AY633_08525 [Planococcus maritimus]